MILQKEQNPNTITLKSEFSAIKDKQNFIKSVEVLNIVSLISRINNLEHQTPIPTKHHLKAIESIYSGVSLTDAELSEYFNTAKQIHDNSHVLSKTKSVDCFLNYDTECIFFGLSQAEHNQLSKEEKERLYTIYSNLLDEVYENELTVSEFIGTIRIIITELKG